MKEATWNRAKPVSAEPRAALTGRSFIRLSGLALVIGSAVSVLLLLVGAITAYITQPIYIASEYLVAAASVVLLLGLPGVYASRVEGFGVVGLIGMALIFTATIMVGVFANLYGAMVDPWLTTEAPNLANGFGPPPLFAYFNVAEVALVVGSVLWAIPIFRGRVSPRWPARLLLLSVVIGVVFFFLIPSLTSTMATSLLAQIPTILLLVALAGLGYETWSKPIPAQETVK
ncbi:MAG TPA: hypothetical protein VF383_03795 [Candidatus Dormibacteraeota bacterium]